jgi:Rap1a immunity proteins
MLALATTTAGAAEEDESANFWLPHCRRALDRNARQDFLSGLCMGMIEGVSTGLQLADPFGSEPEKPTCIHLPKGVTNRQMVAVVIKWNENHPQDMHRPFLDNAASALALAWHCK